jgi:hypothetical protein
MTNSSLSQLVAEDARLQLKLAIWCGLIVSMGIYFVGIFPNNSKAAWIKPTCSALAFISGTSVLGLRGIVEVDEHIRQSYRDILMQARQDALYQSSNKPVIVRSSLKQADI